MSSFILKIIAVISMIVDHFAAFLQLSNSDLIRFEYLVYMRAFGRMALPIFIYLIVIGFSKTGNLRKYLGRMHLFALISQIPFVLTLNPKNYIGSQNLTGLSISYEPINLIYIFLIIISYYYFILDKKFDSSIIYISLAYLITPITLKLNNSFLLVGDSLNIFYELGISLILISYLERFRYYFSKKDYFNIVLIIIAMVVSYYYVGSIADYGYSAILLALLLRIFKFEKLLQVLIILIWGYFKYKWSMLHVLFVALSSLLIYLYNGKKGPSLKYLFYIFYPMHILIIYIIKYFELI